MNDKEVKNLINLEESSHKNSLNLIASENYPSKDVLNACGSIFSTKYAEGYPGARYYEGCEISDDIENLINTHYLLIQLKYYLYLAFLGEICYSDDYRQ